MKKYQILNYTELPDVLSDLEFNYYFEQFKLGDFSMLDKLVLHNLKLVYWYIDTYIKCSLDEYEEIFSVSCEALIESLYKYDISKGVKFSTYLIPCIKNKILKYFRNEKKYKNIISFDDTVYDGSDTCYKDFIVDSNYSFEDEIIDDDLLEYRKKIIKIEIDNLNDIDREIFLLYFGFVNNKTYGQSDIAKKLGITQSCVSKRLSKMLKRIKDRVFDEDVVIDNFKLVKKAA